MRITAGIFEFHIVATPPQFILNQASKYSSVNRLFDMERIPHMVSDSDYAILGVMSVRYEYPHLKQIFLAHRFKRPKYTVFISAVKQYSSKWHKKIIAVPQREEPRQEKIRPCLQPDGIAHVNAVASEPASHENCAVVASVSDSNDCEPQSQATPVVVDNGVESCPAEAQAQTHSNQLLSSSVQSSTPVPLFPARQEQAPANPFLRDVAMELGRALTSVGAQRSDDNEVSSSTVAPIYRQVPSSAVDPIYRNLLRQCPYGLARIAEERGPLEFITGLELMGIFRVAKHYGHLSDFKELLSCRPVTAVEKEEDLLRHIEWKKCKKDKKSKREHAALRGDETSTIPLVDPMASRPPQVNHCRTVMYEYGLLVIAGRDLPVVMVTCHEPYSTDNRMCHYGGFDESGNRRFLPDWT